MPSGSCRAGAGAPGGSIEDIGVAHHADENTILLRLHVRHPDMRGPVRQHLRHDRREGARALAGQRCAPAPVERAPHPPRRHLVRLETDTPAAELLRPG